MTIEQLRLESERKSLYTQIKDYLDKHSPDYKSILASLTSAETALNKLLADAGIGDLNVLSVIGTIRDKYQESSEFLAEIDSDVKARKASAEAHIKTAEFYEKSAQEYLGKHKELKKTLKDELGFDLPDDAISTETRNTYTRGLLGKKEISVQITHLNSYWLYYEDFTNRAKAARKSAYKILGRDGDLDNPQYNLNIAESLNDQLLKAQAVNSAWKIANDQANVVEGRLNQLRSLINVINLGNVQSQEYQNAINNLQTLLPDLKNQLTEAQQKATNAYQTVKQQWSDFNQSADQLQQVYNELIPLKSQYKAENISLLGKLEDAKTWVTQKRQSLALQLESVNDVRTRLEEFVNSSDQKPSIGTILNSVQKLLIHNESLLKDRLAALGEHEEALDAQQTLLLKELELVDAYFDNGGREYSLLRQELEQAQNSLQELQLLAQEALDSSTILTKNIDQITIYLDSVNDEYLDSVKDSHDTLKDLVNSLNLTKGKFEESKQVIDNINTAESDIIKLLQKIKDNGETRVTKILEMAKLRGLAVAADIFWQDFTDLLSDTGNFFAGGIATPEDKKLAKSFRKELMTQRTLKRSAEVDANQAGLAIKQAQAQQAVLDAKIKESQASYDKLRSEIADLNQTTEAQQATLQKLQLRQAALERLQDVTKGIIKNLLDIQQVNLKLAELEIRYAESFASDIEGNTARQIALEALALNYQKQRLATQVEIYQRADIESTLQASLIEIGRNLGLEITPIVEAGNNQEAIIDLQEQIDRLQKSPLLPDDIEQLLNKVNQDLSDALAGKEASEIKQNIKEVTEKLIDQQSEYRKELEKLATEAEDDSQLLQTAETDLKSAADKLWNAIQTRENYLTDKSILSDQVLNVLTEVRLAESANKISTELAQKARTIFADILEQRQIEREARQKTLFDFLLEATGTVLQIAASFVTAGSTLALTIGVMAAVNQAIIAIRNGDVLKAIYYGVQSALLGAGGAIKALPDGASVLGVSEDTLVKIIGKSGKALSNIYKGGMAIATGDYIDAIKDIYKLGATINVIDDIKDWGILREVSEWLEDLPWDYIASKLLKVDGLGSFTNLFVGVGFRIIENLLPKNNPQFYSVVASSLAFLELSSSVIGEMTDFFGPSLPINWLNILYKSKQIIDISSDFEEYKKRLNDIEEERINQLTGYNVSTDVSIKWNTDGSSFSTEDPILLDGIESKIENLQEIKLSQPLITPDNRLPTTIIIHGEDDSLYQQWTPELGSRIKRLEKVANNQESNVLIINWSNLLATEYIDTFNYSERIQTKVDKSAQALAQKLFGEYNLDPSKVNIIGHGLGYQLATKIGQWTLENKNQKLKEIVVLEPTLNIQQSQIVNPDSVAQKVEVIRSDYQGLYHYVFPTLKQNLGTTRIGSGYSDGKTTDSLDYYLPESVNKFFYGSNHFDAIQVYLSFLDSQLNSANQSQENFEQYLQRLSQSLDNDQTSNLNSDPTGLDFSSVNERLTLNYFSGHPTLSGYYLSSPFYAAPGVEKQYYTFADFSQDISSYAEKSLKIKITRVTEATGGNWQHFNPLGQAWQDLEINQEIIFNIDSQIRYQSANLSKESAFLDWEILEVQGQEENDDLPVITLAVSPASVTEDGTTNLIYTFTRNGVTSNALTVNYTVGGTATIGTDYTGIATTETTKTVTFAAGSPTATVTVDPTADTTVESDETVALTLASGTGYIVETTGAVTRTIANDDTSLAITPTSAIQTEGNSGNKTFTFTLTRSGSTTGTNAVNWTVTGTANNPANATDFGGTLPSGILTFAANETSKVITVNVSGDTTVEPDENFIVTLSSPTNGATITTATATAIITNDDVVQTVNLAIAPTNATQTEGNSGNKAFNFTVTRSGTTTGTNAVNWAVTGTGINAADFGGTLPSGIVTFAANETSKVITVNVSGDTTVEPDENFIVTLSSPTNGATITTATATGIIQNDDISNIDLNPPQLTYFDVISDQVDISNQSQSIQIKLGLSDDFSGVNSAGIVFVSPSGKQGISNTIWPNYDRVSGDALNGVYQKILTLPRFAEVGTWQVRDISFYDNAGNGKYFTRSELTNPSFDLSFVVGITQSSLLIAITPTNATQTEGNSGNKAFTFTVTRSGSTTGINAVNWTVTGTGTNPANATDFGGTLPSGILTFAANETSKVITVNVSGDTTVEPDENFIITLSNPTNNATLTTTSVTGTITNDDVFTPIESAGNTKLVKDATNKYFTQVGTNTPIAIKNGGQQIYQDIYGSGWQTIAAETVNGDNQVLWKNVAGNYLHIWRLDSNWNWVSSEGNWGLNSAEALTQETNFSIDANGDGVIGNPYTAIESAGNTKLVKDAANKYFTQVGTNTPIAIKNGGQQIYQDIYGSGWQTIAAEKVNGDNQVLWKNVSGNYLHIWSLDSNWNFVSSQGNWGLNSAEALTQENNFGIDTNGDGVIGNPYTAIESAGNTKLVKDATNKYFTQIGTNTPTAIKNGGQQIYENIYAGWQTIAAETVNGDNQVLWKNISGNYLHIWSLDSNWNWVSSEGNWGLNSAEALTQENNFAIDANGDGVIGYTPIESAGNTKLVKDPTNKYFAQVGTNTPIAIKNGGQQIYQDIYGSGWQTIAAETVNGVNQVLWKNISGNFLHIWNLDSNWNWVSSEGQYALNSADAFTQETKFGIGANGDGSIGNPSSLTLTGTSANDILIGGANNDILTGGGGKDTLTGGLSADKFVYQNLTDSLLANFDVITDFNATTGNDLFRVSTARAGFVDVGAVNTLDAAGMGAKLTAAAFGSNFAAQFSFGQKTFVAINDATAGFNAANDAIIEVTGLTGTLNVNHFVIV
ncbi:Serralysin C [Dolichospermum sp. UHCC 0315A]|uniref:Calx-beta domain-containing protein n=1 Tax=Dolichospermum sp. UHCC 0315A TaxID=1914871 RepID=UPI001252DC6D|nr:Calx-beta domain-containing protein [Dolichospermum sp. UHCC 0315A]QEI41538.1 Serralysin C [Dolichospermum sp. UHCC 0315A]